MFHSEDLVDSELHVAVRCGDFEGAKRALDDGLKPNKIGLFEWSAVHESAHNGDLDILSLLVAYGGDCNKKDLLNGSTAVHYAASEGHSDCLEYLLSNGGDITQKNNKGQTVSEVTHDKQCIEVLSKFGVKVNATVRFKELGQNKKKLKSSPVFGSLPKLVLPDADKSEIEQKSSYSPVHSFSSLSGGPSSFRSCSSLQSLTSIGSSIEESCAGYITVAFQYNRKRNRLAISISEIILSCLQSYENAKKDFAFNLLVQGFISNSQKSSGDLSSKSDPFRLRMGGTEDSPHQETLGGVESFWSSKCAFIKFSQPFTLDFPHILIKDTEDRMVQLSIYLRQRRAILRNSSQGTPIATMELPLQNAVKRLRKERYELDHCGTGYDVGCVEPMEQMLSEIVIDAGSVTSDSVIIGMRRPSVLDTGRCVSDSDLKLITSDSQPSKDYLSPHSSINMPLDKEDNRFRLQEVRSHLVPSSPQVHIRVPAEAIDNSDEELEIVVSQ